MGWDCTAKIWSKLGELQGELKGHPRPINCVAFNPEGDLVATACWDACIRVFNLYDRSRKAVLRGHVASVRALTYSSNGVYIASSSIDSDVKLWNSRNGSQIATLKAHSLSVNALRFSPNSQFLVTTSSDCSTKVWSGSVGKMTGVITDESATRITSVCFEQTCGELIAVGLHSGEIRLYELTGSGTLKCKLKPHSAQVKRLVFSSHGRYLISACDVGSAKVIDVSSLENANVVAELTGNTKSINALAISKSNVVLLGSEDCLLSVYANIFEHLQSDHEDDMFDLFGDTPMLTRSGRYVQLIVI